MPTYEGTTVYLISQYDARVCPEYSPGKPADPFVEDVKLFEEDKRAINVYTPVYPCSQLWVAYDIKPPESTPEVKYYYFKLLINGRHVVSWGCGEDDKWQGKTMFSMFASQIKVDQDWIPCIETRSFSFGRGEDNDPTEPKQDHIEIQMFRARARKRKDPKLQRLKESEAADLDHHASTRWDDASATISLFNRGPLMYGQPKRFYKYALLDPVDAPYITFRFHYRPLPQLERLGVCALDELEEMRAAEDAQRPAGEPMPSRSNEPQLIPSISLRSILSAASASEIPKMPLYPVFALTQKNKALSPSPLRVPDFLKFTPRQLARLSAEANELSWQTRDSLESDEESGSGSGSPESKPSIYLNDNGPLLAGDSPGAKVRLSKRRVKDASQMPKLEEIPLLRPRPSREDMFRVTVSTLLEHPIRPETPEPSENSSPTPRSRRTGLFSRTSSETLRSNAAEDPPNRSTSAMSNNSVTSTRSVAGTWMNNLVLRAKNRAESKAKVDELNGSPTEKDATLQEAHQQSMSALNGVLSSARKRQERSKEKESYKGKARAMES